MSQGDDIVAAIEKEIARVTIDATLEITSELITHTPVDTGFARSSWVPSIGEPVESNLLADPSEIREVAAEQNAGMAQILSYELDQGPVYITNQARYIERLNKGSSKQAPSGFVERAIAKGTQTAQDKADARQVKL